MYRAACLSNIGRPVHPQTTAITVVPFPALTKVLEPVDADMFGGVFCTPDHPLLGELYVFESDEALDKLKKKMVA